MENEKPPNDIRMVIVVALFFLCIVGGGIFLALYVILPTSPPWYAVVGMVLVGIPWIVWLVAYLYSCIKIYRNARELDNNAGRVFPKASMSRRSFSNARRNSERVDVVSPRSPAPPNGNNDRHVQFGGVVYLEENNNDQAKDEENEDECQAARERVNKGRESEIPLKSSSASS